MQKSRRASRGPRALAFDLAYSLESLRALGQERHITQRDLEGYFDHVYTVYPLLGIDPADYPAPFGESLRQTPLSERHTFIEQKAHVLDRAPLPVSLLLSQASLVRYCCSLVHREGIDVIRGTEPFFTGTLAWTVARLTGRPFCLRLGSNFDALAKEGNLPFPRLFKTYDLACRVSRHTFRSCDLLLPANANYRDYAVANGAHPERIEVIPYGSVIAQEHFSAPESRGSPPEGFPGGGGPVLLMVGRLLEVKRPFDVLEAAVLIREKVPDVRVLFVGDGPLRDPLERKNREMGLQKNVFFLGARNQDWIHRAYPHATAYLSPLTGRALAEAALGELPAVAYDCDWHSELVKTGVTGELVPDGDIQAMASSAVRICSDPNYRKKLGKNARGAALDMMSPEVLLERERRAFDKLLGRNDSSEN